MRQPILAWCGTLLVLSTLSDGACVASKATPRPSFASVARRSVIAWRYLWSRGEAEGEPPLTDGVEML